VRSLDDEGLAGRSGALVEYQDMVPISDSHGEVEREQPVTSAETHEVRASIAQHGGVACHTACRTRVLALLGLPSSQES